MGVPEGEKVEKMTERISEEIMAPNSPSLMRTINPTNLRSSVSSKMINAT